MTSLIITRGLPGSGKTTWARDWVEALPLERARVNRDDLRHLMFGAYWGLSYEQEELVSIAQQAAVERLLRNGTSVVVDDTNLRLKHARAWANLARDAGAEFSHMDFDVPVDECVRRDAARQSQGERYVGGPAIRKMHQRFAGWAKNRVIADAPQSPTRTYEPDEDLDQAWMVDVDGTLALRGERGPFDWHRVGEDTVNEPVRDLVAVLKEDFYIVLLSGRKESCRSETEEWLDRNGVAWDELWMRADDDDRNDAVVKQELFFEHVAPRYCVLGVLDDRDRVVEMWRSIGLFCAQVAPGDF